MSASDTPQFSGQETIPFPKSKTLLFTCYVLFLAWAEIIAFFILLLLTILIGMVRTFEKFLLFDLVAMGITILIYLLMALTLRCQSCGKKFLVQSLGGKHSLARSVHGMDFWASTIMDVVKSRKFVCMYCGQEHSIKKSSPTST